MIEVFKGITEMIKKYQKVYIMTHKNPDLDGLGASICLYEIIKSFKKECYIIDTVELKNNSVKKMYDILKEKGISVGLKQERQAIKEITDDTLLIILDVHKKERAESAKLVDVSKHIVLIDHHIKGTNYIKETELCYINSGISSVSEWMVYYLKYLNKIVDPVIATILITGIEIDTNNYKLKTTEKTYEAGAILTSMGADSILKQELLKENKEDYVKKSYFINQSQMINDTMALCIMDETIYNPTYLAEIAEQLLQFDHVEASFVIGRIEKNMIGISARSLGNIDVEDIMSILGGGGHKTDAATQLADSTIETVKNKLLEIIK